MPLSVLIVDDDDSVRALVRRLLGEAVRVVGEASNGEEAVRLARELRPDVVLLDIRMPVMDGLEATRKIKSERPQVKVILLTGHGEEAYLESTGKSGADAFLPKRKVRTDVLSAIREAAALGPGPHERDEKEARDSGPLATPPRRGKRGLS
jgi:DNA-binding NarL/FixJ family response regulator